MEYTFFWINLDRAVDRRKNMEEQFLNRKINNIRISAIDGNNDTLNEYVTDFDPKYKLQIATALSHLKAVEKFLETRDEIGIICEDDMTFELESMWPYTLESVIQNAPLNWDVIQLSITIDNKHPWDMSDERYQPRKKHWYSCLCYAITKSYALKLMNKYKLPLKIDIQNSKNIVSELIIYNENTYTLYPPPFTYPTNNDSYIHPWHINTHNASKKIVIEKSYIKRDK